jgi:four helix bundle protein
MSGIRSREVEVRTKSDVATFEDFEVFRRAYRISLDVHRASLAFPAVEQYGLADQIRRASKSICGNIAEGFGKRRRSTAEFKRYLLMAIGSADEMQVWLRYCSDLEYVDRKVCAIWRDEYRQIAKMLQGLYTALGAPSDP